jgi:hypothetical protein
VGVDLDDGEAGVALRGGPDRSQGDRMLAAEDDGEFAVGEHPGDEGLDFLDHAGRVGGEEGFREGVDTDPGRFGEEFLVEGFHVPGGVDDSAGSAGCSPAVRNGSLERNGDDNAACGLVGGEVVGETAEAERDAFHRGLLPGWGRCAAARDRPS